MRHHPLGRMSPAPKILCSRRHRPPAPVATMMIGNRLYARCAVLPSKCPSILLIPPLLLKRPSLPVPAPVNGEMYLHQVPDRLLTPMPPASICRRVRTLYLHQVPDRLWIPMPPASIFRLVRTLPVLVFPRRLSSRAPAPACLKLRCSLRPHRLPLLLQLPLHLLLRLRLSLRPGKRFLGISSPPPPRPNPPLRPYRRPVFRRRPRVRHRPSSPRIFPDRRNRLLRRRCPIPVRWMRWLILLPMKACLKYSRSRSHLCSRRWSR